MGFILSVVAAVGSGTFDIGLQNPLATMPIQEPERSVEGIRRALPELIKLYRYESRAAARRDRAVRELSKRRIASAESARPGLAKQTPPA
jgi:hypothetical protein